MRSSLFGLAGLMLLTLGSASASAMWNPPGPPGPPPGPPMGPPYAPWGGGYNCPVPYIPSAPDACNGGFYALNCCGCLHGPNYCLYPPFPPHQGALPPPNGGGAGAGAGGAGGYRTHPYARSPRDFFMIGDGGRYP